MTLNASGKPLRSAKHRGHPQAELVGVGLTKPLCAPLCYAAKVIFVNA
jgi:hypothetical protein